MRFNGNGAYGYTGNESPFGVGFLSSGYQDEPQIVAPTSSATLAIHTDAGHVRTW